MCRVGGLKVKRFLPCFPPSRHANLVQFVKLDFVPKREIVALLHARSSTTRSSARRWQLIYPKTVPHPPVIAHLGRTYYLFRAREYRGRVRVCVAYPHIGMYNCRTALEIAARRIGSCQICVNNNHPPRQWRRSIAVKRRRSEHRERGVPEHSGIFATRGKRTGGEGFRFRLPDRR